MRPLRYGRGQHAIDTDQGEQRRNGSEEARRKRAEARSMISSYLPMSEGMLGSIARKAARAGAITADGSVAVLITSVWKKYGYWANGNQYVV